MLRNFMSSVQTAQSKLSAACTCVEDYVEKMLFVEQYMAEQKAMDAACNQVCMGTGSAVFLAAEDWTGYSDLTKGKQHARSGDGAGQLPGAG